MSVCGRIRTFGALQPTSLAGKHHKPSRTRKHNVINLNDVDGSRPRIPTVGTCFPGRYICQFCHHANPGAHRICTCKAYFAQLISNQSPHCPDTLYMTASPGSRSQMSSRTHRFQGGRVCQFRQTGQIARTGLEPVLSALRGRQLEPFRPPSHKRGISESN